jgi:glycosyltransferase involved in cell wall biosynthesis
MMLITCIIPTRNRPDYVREAVESVLRQTHKNLELVIVDDGDALVMPIVDERMRVLKSRKAGAVAARNLGVAAARGEIIAWLDDDDIWGGSAFLEDCVDAIHYGSDFVFGDGELIFPDGTRKFFAHDASPESLQRDNTILISAVCYRRSLHQSLGTFDEALPYYWDWDWYLRVARAGHVMTRLKTPLVDIRIHENNMSGLANTDARAANLELLRTKHGLPEIPLKSHIDFV